MAAQAQDSPFFYVIDQPLDILFVDDDPILREFATVHLTSDQVTVTTAEDGLDAFDRLAVRQPDIILLDLEMPNMDGFQFLEQLRRGDMKDIPVIVVTGREDVTAIDRAYRAGATSFVVKPLNWRQITYQVRYVYRSHIAQSETPDTYARLLKLAQSSAEFLAVAMAKHPDLMPIASKYAAEIGEVLEA